MIKVFNVQQESDVNEFNTRVYHNIKVFDKNRGKKTR